MKISDFEVRRVLVDSRSMANILFKDTFDKLQVRESNIQPMSTPLVGFNGEEVKPLGRISVPVEVGMWPNITRFKHTFLVVATPSPYNAIIGRPINHALRAVVSTYYLAMKFPMDFGVGVVWGDQLKSRKCYIVALKEKARLADDVKLERPVEYPEERATPTEETIHILTLKEDLARTL
ncbi:PREDICTED: uncharacterized protein LOC109114090 [Nelumbo nucifera]|uniref:Uncharacterized protein LOC109114090 n=1 Tax=Nelumbo nucifera TaxID=4432 RepID=A0A1U8PYV0_NELNU|nr:PREDICTED: uncharacterized protein LOC109114090 [Nelumbo nucifera]